MDCRRCCGKYDSMLFGRFCVSSSTAYYIDFLTEDFAEIRKGSGVDNMDIVEHVYKTIICNLKTLAQNHYIEDTVDMREARFVDW